MNVSNDLTEGTPENLSPEIARANLFRMRGDYKGAIDQCLSVLKRAPEDMDAHVLVADIYAEQGDLGQAAQWYELALDLDASDSSTVQKLANLQVRMREREAASAAKAIGLPPERTPYWLYAGVLLVIFAVIAIGAYMLGERNKGVVPSANSRVTATAPRTEPEPGADTSPNPAETPRASTQNPDRAIETAIASRLPAEYRLLSAIEDPRTNSVTLTIAGSPQSAPRIDALTVSESAFTALPNVTTLIVRSVRSERVVHVATIDRSRWSEAAAGQWANADAMADHVLRDEWPAHPASTGTGSGVDTATNPPSTDPEPSSQ